MTEDIIDETDQTTKQEKFYLEEATFFKRILCEVKERKDRDRSLHNIEILINKLKSETPELLDIELEDSELPIPSVRTLVRTAQEEIKATKGN